MYLSGIWRILVGMHSGERWRLGRRPALDGLRAVAVLLVIAYHVDPTALPGGGVVGVTVFFALSGFLITSLLLEERATTGRVDVRGFYVRRARRLLPALALMLAVVGPVAVAAGNISIAGLGSVVFYSANWWSATGHHLGMLTHTWTLATEEQFYLLWPVALLALRRTSHAVTLTLAVAVLLLFSGVLGAACSSVAVLAGCALALWLHGRPKAWSPPRASAPVLLVGLLGASEVTVSNVWTVAVATALATAAVYAIGTAAEVPFLSNPGVRAVGRRSYGLYLWHLPVIAIVGAATQTSGWSAALVSLPVLAGVTELSWRYVEQPFLRGDHAGPYTQAASRWAITRASDSAVL